VQVRLESAGGRAVEVSAPAEGPYAAQVAALREAVRGLPSVSAWKGGEIRVEVAQEAGWLNWEAVVASALAEGREAQVGLDIRRWVPESFAPGALQARALKYGLSIGAPSRGLMWWAREAWRGQEMLAMKQVRMEELHKGWLKGEVLHLVASPVRTAYGPRLEVGREAVQQQQQPAEERGELVAAEDVVAGVKGLRACVLQGPEVAVFSRGGNERMQAAEARAFAAGLVGTGQLTAVLVVPPLPEELFQEVQNQVRHALVKAWWPESLAREVVGLRGEVYRRLGGTEEAWETAMDVCLYVPHWGQWRE
jgi:hypothetical protein